MATVGVTCSGSKVAWSSKGSPWNPSKRKWKLAAFLPHDRYLGNGSRVRVALCKAFVSEDLQKEVPRPVWLPGLDPPAHLDGSLPGDYGFDPLELGKEPEALRWYVQAELIHARFAMAGVAGILFTDVLRTFGLRNIPIWYEAGATHFDFADTRTLFFVQLLLMGFVETKRYMDIVIPHSQGAENSFLGIEPALRGLEPGYPGGPLFNPAGFALGIEEQQIMRVKELKNGRLAMVAMVGFFVQAAVTKVGPTENLLTHLSDPWHHTILQTLADSH
ncbi:hypothetical protein KP509_37G034400 [Ceratopteris richardii]|uniref:Chlorophyll a-b binding protein, chloroplastic n=1 Tax=Ceratopteris richardii TaxID=49495 RepID=A0A8T2Q7P3_CERRI|nr:hypothetical protein KP509_37G034400 [Ceratopteris richardii]